MDAAFASLDSPGDALTPFAVEARYDNDFWPTIETVREARDAARTIRDFVLLRLPPGLRRGSTEG
jgi:hypothetical protein